MRRPRKQDLRKLDKNSQAYWDEVLRREGHSMRAGDSKRISYVGSTQVIEFVADMVLSGVRPDDRDLDNSYDTTESPNPVQDFISHEINDLEESPD